MKGRLIVFVVGCVLALTATTFAHHSFTATYQSEKTLKIEGKVAQFIFRNPHSYVHVLAPDESGKVVRWAVEWQGAGQLGNRGMSAQTLKAGDSVVIVGNPGRDPAEHRMRMVSIKRTSDGFDLGTRPGEVVN